jgi:hypothetical protein
MNWGWYAIGWRVMRNPAAKSEVNEQSDQAPNDSPGRPAGQAEGATEKDESRESRNPLPTGF